MNATVLTFTSDGKGHGLYTEDIELGCIGGLTIRRATRIEFDNQAQVWRVYPVHGQKVLYHNPSRQACLDWERQHLEPNDEIKHTTTKEEQDGESFPDP